MKRLFYVGILSALLLAACGEGESNPKEEKVIEASTNKENVEEEENKTQAEEVEPTPKQQLSDALISLFDEKLAFDSGDYIQGDIPKGDYAFVRFNEGQYYSEENQNGDIVDNENFDSFGYVFVHGVGNISNGGLLINISAFDKLNVSSAKQIFEMLNDKTDYTDAGYYKVGVDIPAGSYVLESYGDAYGEVATGPVGNSEIVTNNNFNGRYQVNVVDGQYLVFSNAMITQQ
ncbi:MULTISPECIES: hypothetical protein [Lysinibacillus]|uniref:hypothetical protein n=1 Tax=Lysinibacillus TaxID=400634 RepID=UPI00214C32A4|nr:MULTISPECIES: hypothetical protein [Lysinibacillus]UUV23824.1 hypothetical protein NP781_18745 [Lysinibacillus sp. FN11]UYB46695.1 hypothetical protein OCI51_21355 [Lysinibacillus capsici]